MESAILRRSVEESSQATRFLVMRNLARFHECDIDALLETIEATRPEMEGLLQKMVSEGLLGTSPLRLSRGRRRATFSLTLEGWAEYLGILGSLYELPE